MSKEKRLPDPTLGRKFPERLLNALPRVRRIAYLVEHSGGSGESADLSFADHFRDARRLVLAWPEAPEECLAVYPAVAALVEALPKRDPAREGATEADILHLSPASVAPLIRALFGTEPAEWAPEDLAWHDPAARKLAARLKAFAPDVALVLAQSSYPLVLQAVLRASGAPARVGWEDAVVAPFCNIRLRPDPALPLAARAFQCHGLWRYAGLSPLEEWRRIHAPPASRAAVAAHWTRLRAVPEATWLYVHEASSGPLGAALYGNLDARVAAHDLPGYVLGAVVRGTGAAPLTREGPWRDAPVFETTDDSELLALLESARGVVAFHGFGLHFAALADVRCLGLLRREEAAYACIGLNPLFEAEWL